MDVSRFRSGLLAWWEGAQRDFPWRRTKNAYHIFGAEVLLHRTRAQQVVPLYEALLKAYPSVEALAAAKSDEVLRLLHSAGLRWRINLLMDAARVISHHFKGEFPEERKDLESIPGIGHYIAAAIQCFAFGHTVPIVDSNVVRVYARVFEIPITDSLRRDKAFHQLAQNMLDPESPRDFNLALLDLADAVCTPRNPKCEQCPLLEHCAYGTQVVRLSRLPSAPLGLQ